MIEEPGSFSGNQQLGETGSRPAGHQADVVGDFVEGYRERTQRAGELHQSVVGTLNGELVGRADKRQPGEPGDFGCGRLGKTGRGVDARAYRRAAEREPIDALEGVLDPLEVVRQHPGIARPFLAERQRRRVLHMGAADLDDVLPFAGLRGDGVVQRLHGWDQPLLHTDRRGDVHRGRKRIVGRLGHIDVIVGMDRRLAAQRRAGKLAAAIGDHLVHVHVELGAAAGHPHMQREHVVVLAREDFVACLHDQLVGLVVESPSGMVGIRRGFLEDGIGG